MPERVTGSCVNQGDCAEKWKIAYGYFSASNREI